MTLIGRLCESLNPAVFLADRDGGCRAEPGYEIEVSRVEGDLDR